MTFLTNSIPHLYYANGTRSTRPLWLLEELGIAYKLSSLNLKQAEHKNDSYLNINPLSKVPSLTIGNLKITESLAICLFLADQFPDKLLAPAQGTIERVEYYKWMSFSIGTFEPALLDFIRRQKSRDPSPRSNALSDIFDVIQMIENTLAERDYLLGDRFSAADIMVGSIANWANQSNLLSGHHHVSAWLNKLKARPAFIKSTNG